MQSYPLSSHSRGVGQGALLVSLFLQPEVRLDSGATLRNVQTAYLVRGELAADGRNAVLIAHGYTSGPDMIHPGGETAEGSWDALIGPGKPFDTDRYFVVCPNALGSSYGSTNAASINPATNRPYGSRFPDITLRDIVAVQKELLDSLGVKHLVAVAGPSFGGAQAFQWGVDYPDFMDALVVAVAAPAMPNANVTQLEAELSSAPGWNGGDYYGLADLTEFLTEFRMKRLAAFGADAVLQERFPDPAARQDEMRRMARHWAEAFDANSLLILFKAMSRFDVTKRLHEIKAPLLYVLSRTDTIFPPEIGRKILPMLQSAGLNVRYHEIDSEFGHAASGKDAAKWASILSEFLADAQKNKMS